MRPYLIAAASVLAALLFVGLHVLLDGSGGGASEPGSELRIEGAVSHVRDGDTIEIGGVAVRLANLDCAERDTEAGQAASERMARLVQGETVTCELEGRQSYDREVGTCALASTGQDVGEVLIAEGACDPWVPSVPYLPLHRPHREQP